MTQIDWPSLLAGVAAAGEPRATALCSAFVTHLPETVATFWHVDPGASLATCVAGAAGAGVEARMLPASAWAGQSSRRHGDHAPWDATVGQPVLRRVDLENPSVWSPESSAGVLCAIARLATGGEGAGYLVVVCPDAASADRAHSQLSLVATASTAATRPELDFQALSETDPNLILVLQEGRVVYANPATLQIVGYTRREIQAEEFDPLTLMHPRDRERVRRAVDEAGKGDLVEGPIEITLLARDGSLTEVLATLTPHRTPRGRILHLSAVDITERVRLETELFAYTGQVGALQELLLEILALDLTRSQIVERMCKSICAILGADIVSGMLFTADRQCMELTAYHGPAAARPGWISNITQHFGKNARVPWEQLAKGNLGACLERREPVVVEHVATNASIVNRHLIGSSGLGSYMWVPLLQGDDVLGTLFIGFKAATVSLSQSQLQSLSLFAAQTALAIQKATLVDEERQRQRESAQLLAASAALRDDLTITGLYEHICAGARRIVPCEYAALLMPEGEMMRIHYADSDGPTDFSDLVLPIDASLSGQVFQAGQTLRRSGANAQELEHSATLVGITLDDVLIVPLISHRQTVGVLALINKKHDVAFTDRDQQLIETFAQQAAGTLDNATLLAQVIDTKEYLEYLLEGASDIIYTHDLNGNLTSMNAIGRQLAGWTPGKDLPSIRDVVHPEDLPVAIEHIRAKLEGRPEQQPYELRVRDRDGQVHVIELATKLIERDGHPIGVLGIGRDVTRRRQMEEQVRRSERLAALGGLLSGVAHELNNPLTGVLGYAEMLAASRDPNVAEQATRIFAEARRCRAIVDSLLSLHPDAGLEAAAVACGPLVEQAVGLVSYRFESDNVRVATVLQQDLPSVCAPSDQLQRTLLQVLQNAYEAILSTGDGGEIVVSVSAEDDWVRIVVEDSGPGIPTAVRDRIFDPFYTTKDDAPGRGLGLSMVNNVVTAAGGRVTVEPASTHGTRVILTLPANTENGSPAHPVAPDADPRERTAGPPRVLVVDDEEVIRDLLTDLLEMMDYEVDTVEDGHAALTRLEEQRYHAIISDIKMPGMGGIELYDHLVRRYPESVQRVIFASGDTLGDDTREFLSRTGRPCIRKPFNISDIRTAVQDILGVTAAAGG